MLGLIATLLAIPKMPKKSKFRVHIDLPFLAVPRLISLGRLQPFLWSPVPGSFCNNFRILIKEQQENVFD